VYTLGGMRFIVFNLVIQINTTG